MSMRVAIVGAGVSGLVAAHLLQSVHDVTVFEADERPGGHAHTVAVETETGTHAVDTGFIVFNDRNYPHFERLLARLSVASQPSTMSFSVSDERGDFEYNGSSPNGLFAKRAHLVTPWFHRMVADLARFNREARALLRSGEDPSLRDWLAERRYSPAFVERLIVPQAAAVWSADPRPDVELPRALPRRVLRQPRDARLPRPAALADRAGRLAPLRRRAAAAPAQPSAHRHPGHRDPPPRRPRHRAAARRRARALRRGRPRHPRRPGAGLLADASDRERELLGAIPYQPNEAVLHTDATLLPRRRRAWASWNYHLLDEPTGLPTVTYHMNRLQSLHSDTRFCVTLNRTQAIEPEKVIRTIPYAHPVYTRAGVAAQARHDEISGAAPHALLRRLLGLGLPRGRRRERRSRVAQRLGAGMNSALYEGTVRHRRFAVRRHELRHRIALAYVDLDELPRLDGGRLLARRPGLVRFRRRDYLGDPAIPLATPCAPWCASRSPPTARSACSPRCARSATASTRSASTTASTTPST